ncbi:unnamed protein product, partial [Effrenium voratum]
RQRRLSEEDVARLTKEKSACAVLPSGALIEDLEVDPWPLLRELRYRTCLEYPSIKEHQQLEDKYLKPLRSMRGSWWKKPQALELLAKQLDEVGFVVVDDFLPDPLVRALKASNLRLYEQSDMQKGATTGGNERVGIFHRGDVLKWIGYDGETEASRSVSAFTAQVEDAMTRLAHHGEKAAPKTAAAIKGVRWRSETMLTCYPGESRARYFRHTDNSSGNGRLLTALIYLNEDWKPGDGGELRLFYPGEKNLKVRMEVEPIWNRLLLFWSDDRSPHEVLSACRDRFAATVWLYDQKNPNVPLAELGSYAGGEVASTPAKAEAEPEKEPEEEPVVAQPEKEEPALLVFYDGHNDEALQLKESLEGEVRLVDLRTPQAEALKQAGERWSQLLESGADAVVQEAGPVFLCLPTGEVLKHCEREKWMLQYELEYWRSVKPPSEETRKRLQDTLFAPLAQFREKFDPSGAGVWWATPEAVSTWGQALARESFMVLDDFLPAEDAASLAKAVRSMQPKMEPGRGDMVLWLHADAPEMGRLVEFNNALVTLMMELPQDSIQARAQQITALSNSQFAIFPGSAENDDARYIRHVDNEDGLNGRLLTCTFYLNEDWDERDGGEIRLFEPDQRRIKADVAPKMNRLVVFFSDSSVPHEVRRSRRAFGGSRLLLLRASCHVTCSADHPLASAPRHGGDCFALGELLLRSHVFAWEDQFTADCDTVQLWTQFCSLRRTVCHHHLVHQPGDVS